MNKTNSFLSVIFFSLTAVSLLFSCHKLGKIIAIETQGFSNISASGVELDALIIDVGESGLTEHGWCIGTDHYPTVDDFIINNGPQLKYGNYTNRITGLDPETKYFARPYVLGGGQIVYGEEIEFTTNALNFTFTNSWENKIIVKELIYPIIWSANINDRLKIELYKGADFIKLIANEIENSGSFDWTVDKNYQDGDEYRLVISSVENVKLKTETQGFSILESAPPLVISGDISSIAYFTAIAEGRIENFGTEDHVSQHGHCWSKNESPTIQDSKTELGVKNSTGSFSSNLTGLEDNTTYYIRAYAINSVGINYGEEKMFTTLTLNLTDGLVAYYPFNGNAIDESGNGNNGVVHGATITTDRKGNDNSAYSFNGIDNYISVTNTPDHCPTSEITVSGWILVDDFSARHYLLDKRINLTIDPWTSYALYSTTPGTSQTWLASLTTNSTQISVWSPFNNNANQWYHLLMKYDGNTLFLYVNGEMVQSTSQTGIITYSNMDLYIGTAALNEHFTKGKIDDIRIYNRALTEEEIQKLYNE